MKHLKLFFALFAMLALGVTNVWAEEVAISYKDIPDGYKATTGTSGSFTKSVSSTNDLTISYAGINTKSKATAAAHAYGYAMFLKNYGYIYSSSAPSGFYPSKVVVNFGSQTGTSGKAGISFGTDILSTRNSTVTGTVSKSGTCSLENSDKTKLHWNFSTTSANVQVASVTVTYTSIGADETTYSVTLNQPAEGGTIEADKDEAAKGATVTLTATPNAGYKWESWTVTGASGNVAVSNDQFTMPAEDVTVTASFIAKTQYTIKWNVVEGSVEDSKVYEGDALGTLPEADDCSEGKVFIGWTAATSVNPDGSGITYVKETDVPTGDITYNAVYAKEGETKDVETPIVDFNGGGKDVLGAIEGITSYSLGSDYAASNAPYQVKLDGTGDYIQFANSSAYKITTIEIGVKMIGGGNTSTLKTQTSANGTDFTDFNSWSISGSQNTVTSTTVTLNEAHDYLRFHFTKGSNVGLGKLVIKALVPQKSYSNYSLDCSVSEKPALIPSTEELDFGAKYVGFEYTETFTINASNLAEDIALAIDGSTFTVSPTSIAKDATFPQTVTVTYAPTAVGTHNATLNITSGSTLSKTIALTGSAEEATIYTLTALADINPTDKVIIVGTSGGNTYAMSNDKGTSDAPDAIAVTVIDNKIATDKTNILWNIAKDGDNLTIYPADQTAKWLYCLADNNDGVRVGTGEAKLFTIDKGYLYTTQTTAARHIGIYNNSDWRCYKPSADAIHTNIKDQSFAFYVLPNTDPFISATPTSYDFGAVLKGKQTTKEIAYTTTNISSSISVTISNPECFTVVHNSTTKICTVTYTPNAVGTHSATLTIKAEDEASTTVELTGECVETVDVATAMALVKDEIAYFDEFEVVKVVAGKGNIYIKDASGHGLIYDFTLAGQLKDGDRVQGFVGISSPYNGLPEAKPHNVTYADLTITTGTPAQPYDFTSTVIAETDINKYIVFQDVEVTADTDMSTNPTLTIGGNSVDFYNQFGVSKTLEAGKIYDIYGFVAIYNGSLQVYFYEALADGEVSVKYTVTYNAGGATGTVPVDNAEYSEGAQVYLKSATDLTYEGYEYKGWKVTDANGTEIPVSSNKFNMPASNVTVTAQWEEIVVVPKKDFSEGYWVLVTEASELNADDYIVIAAAEEDLAMKSYESGNNCGQIEITKSANLLIWNENVGVFQLLASGSNYTIQDVNTKQYLYAAGTGTSNHLKATDEIPADAEMAKYVWTVSFTDGVPTIKATSENRNTLMYNTGSNLFSCYSSGQKAIALYKYVTELPTVELNSDDNSTVITANAGKTVNVQLNRSFTAGDGYYTLCLPFNIAASEIGTAYTLGAITKHVSGEEGGININLTSVSEIEAGVPYLVLPNTLTNPVFENVTINNIDPATKATSTSGAGVKVTFIGIINGGGQTNGSTEYYVGDQGKLYNGTVDKLGLRAFFTITDEAGNPTQIRARVVANENVETGVENIITTDAPVKVIENGQLIIIRDGVKYNVQGQKL